MRARLPSNAACPGCPPAGQLQALAWSPRPSPLAGNKTVKSINDPNFHDESVFKMDMAQQGTRSVVSKTANGEFFSTIYL